MSYVSAGTAVLVVQDWEETADSAFHEADTWQNGAYTHPVRSYGCVHKWVFTCIEQNVAWANSAVPYLMSLQVAGQSAGTAINLSSSDPRRPISPPIPVIVFEVVLKITSELAAQNIRIFTVDFRQYQ